MADRTALAFILLMGASAGHAAPVYGVGNNTCGEFIQDSRRQVDRLPYSNWIGGFATATNIPGAVPDMVTYLDSYCRAHPFDRVIDGAVQMAKERAQSES